jgi:hypothetical protein
MDGYSHLSPSQLIALLVQEEAKHQGTKAQLRLANGTIDKLREDNLYLSRQNMHGAPDTFDDWIHDHTTPDMDEVRGLRTSPTRNPLFIIHHAHTVLARRPCVVFTRILAHVKAHELFVLRLRCTRVSTTTTTCFPRMNLLPHSTTCPS